MKSEATVKIPATVLKIMNNPDETNNALLQNSKFIIGSSWKKFARIGILNKKVISLTD